MQTHQLPKEIIHLIINGAGLMHWDRDNWADPRCTQSQLGKELFEKWEAFKKIAYDLEVELRKHPRGYDMSERVNEPGSFNDSQIPVPIHRYFMVINYPEFTHRDGRGFIMPEVFDELDIEVDIDISEEALKEKIRMETLSMLSESGSVPKKDLVFYVKEFLDGDLCTDFGDNLGELKNFEETFQWKDIFEILQMIYEFQPFTLYFNGDSNQA